jgi:hypothetical protein
VNAFRRRNTSGPLRIFSDGSLPAAGQILLFLPVFMTISFTSLVMVSGFVFHGLFGSSKEIDLADIAMLDITILYMIGTISISFGLAIWLIFYFASLQWFQDFIGSILDLIGTARESFSMASSPLHITT